jgi:succinyl-diaminopimelate desuccinylase
VSTDRESTILDALDTDALIETTLDLLAFDTRNPPGDTEAAIDYLADRLTSHGVDTTRYQSSADRPNIVARLPGDGDRTLLFNGHVDTVDFEREDWTHDPLGARDGDRLYGRGATDMKGPLAAMLHVALAHADADGRPPVNLAFAFVSDEETGGSEGVATLLELCDIHADACVIGETTCSEGQHSITVADRGSIWLTLEATGTRAHGSRPMLGENAIDRLLDAIGDLRATLAEHEFDLDPAVESIVAESIDYYAPSMGTDVARALFERPTVNLGVIEGGDTINTVPAHARAELDIRLSPGVDTPAVLETLRARLGDRPGVDVADVSWSVGSYTPLDDPIVAAVTETASARTNARVTRRCATGGGDAKKFRAVGVPTVEFALGTDTVHAVDEYTTVDTLAANAHIYASLPGEFDALSR